MNRRLAAVLTAVLLSFTGMAVSALFAVNAAAQMPSVQPHTPNWLSEQTEVELRLKNPAGDTVKLVATRFSDLNARYLAMSVPCWNKVSLCPSVAAITVRLYLKLPWSARINVTKYVLCDSGECLLPPIGSPLQMRPSQRLTFKYDRIKAIWYSHPSIEANMALANVANGVSTSNGFDTASLSWTAGVRGLVSVSSAAAGGGTIDGHTVTGGGVTWNSLGSVAYGDRRRVQMFLSDDTPATGALTITATVTGTYNETQWSADESDEFPNDAAQTATTGFGGGSALNLPDLGTIDAGDLAIFAAGFEGGASGAAVATGSTLHLLREGGGNVRSLLIGFSSTDDTPGVTWTDGNNCGIVGAIFNVSAGGDPIRLRFPSQLSGMGPGGMVGHNRVS